MDKQGALANLSRLVIATAEASWFSHQQCIMTLSIKRTPRKIRAPNIRGPERLDPETVGLDVSVPSPIRPPFASRMPPPRTAVPRRIKLTPPSKPMKVLALIDDALQSSAVGVNDARLRRKVRRMLFRERQGNERSADDFCTLLKQWKSSEENPVDKRG